MKPPDYKALRQMYAQLGLELARQALLEAALERGRQGIAAQHDRSLNALAPYAAYPEVGDTYGEEAVSWWSAQKEE